MGLFLISLLLCFFRRSRAAAGLDARSEWARAASACRGGYGSSAAEEAKKRAVPVFVTASGFLQCQGA